jgi:DeoR/GlpR family transcriptional regulator of sugar metabolism
VHGDLRRAQILADARERGGVSLRELSDRFAVSIPTIRRDLSALADQGLVRRVHGGAVAVRTDLALVQRATGAVYLEPATGSRPRSG